MIMSMNEYIRNPGKSNAVYSARYMYQDMYSSKYAKVMTKEAGKMQYRLFKGKNEQWIIHLKVPSEAISDFYYDVVLEFTPNDSSFSNDLFTYKMRAFSNDPRFVFVFAHSFIKNKMFFEDLVKKMSPQAVRMKPTLTNPKEEIGYVKSIYFAYLYMKDHSLNNKNQWFAAETYHANDLLQNVMDADDKIYLRQKAKPIFTKDPVVLVPIRARNYLLLIRLVYAKWVHLEMLLDVEDLDLLHVLPILFVGQEQQGKDSIPVMWLKLKLLGLLNVSRNVYYNYGL